MRDDGKVLIKKYRGLKPQSSSVLLAKSLNSLTVHTALQLNVWRLLLPGLALRL